MYLFDTNVIFEIRKIKKRKANKNVAAWLMSVPKEQFYTNVVVLMELERGILHIARKDEQQANELQDWYHTAVRAMFAERILPLNTTTATICSSLHIPNRSPESDAWIAASAIQHNLILVTRNTKDFQYPSLRLFNPFE